MAENQQQKLQRQNLELVASNKKLREQRDILQEKSDELREKADWLANRVKELKRENEDLAKQVENNAQIREQISHKDDLIIMMRDEAERARKESRDYASSTSWKITAPLRALINIFK